MNKKKRPGGLNNPHDKLFKETWGDLENTRSFLTHFLPDNVLQVMDLSSLEICKDSQVGWAKAQRCPPPCSQKAYYSPFS